MREAAPNKAGDSARLFGMAVEHHVGGRLADALYLYDAVIQLDPGLAAAHCNRGLALQSLQRFDDALSSYDRAIALQRDYADAYYNRGIVQRQLGRLEDAVRSYDQAIRWKPDHFEAYSNRGNVLNGLKRPEEALRSLDRALALQPDLVEALYNRGNALQSLRRWDEAIACYRRTIALMPDFALAHNNLGNTLKEIGRLDEALQGYRRAIELDAACADAYWNMALCALLMGDFENGWPLYEWRKRKSDAASFPSYPQAVWSGEKSLEGKTLLIHAEQGFGDTIQFCRYAIEASARGARVVLAVQEPLVRLLESLAPGIETIGLTVPLPHFDYYIALLSLPGAMRSGSHNIPNKVPYLRAGADRVAKWRDRLGTDGFRIGICWQGNSNAEIDVGRSFPLACFAGLARMPNVRLISLQKGDGTEQLRSMPAGMVVETLGDGFDAGSDAFVDTAAVMENLDLVITSDTAIAHLAGALARPVWVALKHIPDWRWLLDRSDSLWYPTMRLYRQTSSGDWPGVFSAIEAQLARDTRM